LKHEVKEGKHADRAFTMDLKILLLPGKGIGAEATLVSVRSSDFCVRSPAPTVPFSQPSTAVLACLITARTERGSTSRTMDYWSIGNRLCHSTAEL
jgi:hypothetical protein